jgi:hypothetical protein
MKKVFLQAMFGDPHSWIQPYLDHLGRLEEFGWYWRIFTPNKLKTASRNVDIVPMALGEFDALVAKHCGVKVDNFLTRENVPSKLISDFYCAFGQIFQEYIKDAAFWGCTNFDICYGRLDRWLPDFLLSQYEIWSDDATPAINGIFTLFKNNEKVNNLFRLVPNWEECFTRHRPMAFDEIRMTDAMQKLEREGGLAWGYPRHFPHHSYDRLVMHRPIPHIYIEEDASLIEWFEDTTHPPMTKRHFGRELFLFHFSRTKRWPVGAKPA